MEIQNISLISFGNFEFEFLEQLAYAVNSEFHLNVEIKKHEVDLNDFYFPARRQFDGSKLLKEVDLLSDDLKKTIGLFNVDLFIPILTYIFGQAQFNGRTGIVSTFRLRNELYGMQPDEDLLFERFKKLIIHELGHTFGLKHCHIPSCVMLSSVYVEDLDQKSATFCHNCKEFLTNKD